MTEEVAQPVLASDDVAPVVAPPPGHPRYPLVDSLRAIAALTVLLHHTGYATSAVQNPHYGTLIERTNVGVTLFFVISGFLLYRPFVAARMVGAPATRLRDFVRRRLLRIVPAYWLALTVLAIYPGESGVFSNHWWIYYGFGQIYNDGTVLRGLGQAWSLCVEITFYVALPFYAAAMARGLRRLSVRRQVQTELGLLGLICVASWGYRLYLRTDRPFSWWANTLPVFADWFAFGMALAIVSVALQARARRPPRVVEIIRRWPVLPWAAALLAYVIAADVVSGPHIIELFGTRSLYFSPREDLLLHILFVFAGAGLLIPAVVGAQGGGVVRRILADRRLAWLGLISYGIYLWQASVMQVICQPLGYGFVNDSCRMHGVSLLQHVPFLSLTVISVPVTIACAAASYYVVERPLLRLKYRRTPPAGPAAPAGGSGPAGSLGSPRPAPAVAAGDR
jgi:peptidoglycan/LPS O-acetylase OafA/YrhL